MLKTQWKSAEEIRYSLSGSKKIAIISCDFCSNLCDTSSTRGVKYFTHILEGWGKEVVFHKGIIACCSESLISRVFEFYAKPLSMADMLVLISCPSGLKAASLSNPDLPLYCPVEVEGGTMITGREGSTLSSSLCMACGHCVLSYTGGICPLSGCRSKNHYGPCDNYPRRGTMCSVDPGLPCVWKEIEKKGDLAALKVLKELHENQDIKRLPGPDSAAPPLFLKRLASWATARVSAVGTFKVFRYLK